MKKRKDGRYLANKKYDGKTVSFYGKTPQEVYKKISEYESSINRSSTFNDIAEAWESENWEKLSYGTQNCYRSAVRRAKDTLGEKCADEIAPQDIQKLLVKLAAQKYSGKSVKNQKSVISIIFKYGMLEGMCSVNPAEIASVPRGLPKQIRQPPTDDELRKIMRSEDDWLFPKLLMYTGMRKGEALALTAEDIDRKKKTITVCKEIVFKGNQPELVYRTKTQAGTREIGLLRPLEELIPRDTTGRLFDYTLKRFTLRWKKYCKNTGIDITPHQLRHAYATMLFDAGIDAKEAQSLLGHADYTTTRNIYTHIREARISESTEKLNAHLVNYLVKTQ